MPTHYETLGIAESATQADIKAAWRSVAKATHPDHHPNDPTAEAKFKAASAAFATLSDAAQRAIYDRRLREPPPPPRPAPRPPPSSRPAHEWRPEDFAEDGCITCGAPRSTGLRCSRCELEWMRQAASVPRSRPTYSVMAEYWTEQSALEFMYGGLGAFNRHGVGPTRLIKPGAYFRNRRKHR